MEDRRPLLRSVRMRVIRCLLALLAGIAGVASAAPQPEPFSVRGYYLTFMRMPVMGLPEWQRAIDCFAGDGANCLVLWMAGGFRSKRFPETWQYNADHANVRDDFVPELIRHAHSRGIRILLGFTPFGYDGVNRLAAGRPHLKARKADGSPVDEFGIHCWGWSLCPAKEESRQLMLEYIREMALEFYPQADGLLVESSDYNACHCPDCGPRYYEHEFAFVRQISDEIRAVNPSATIVVYPHYFTGSDVPGLGVTGARFPFDESWGLFFTPHSAHFDAELIRRAKLTIYSGPEAALGGPEDIAAGVRRAREAGVTGYLPSFETFSYVPARPENGEPWLAGRRMRPFGLDPDGAGRMPYDSLLPWLQRQAFRAFTRNPDLSLTEFQGRLAAAFPAAGPQAVQDLLGFRRIWNRDATWYWRSPLLDPEFFEARAARAGWTDDALRQFDRDLRMLREIADRHRESPDPRARDLGREADTVVRRWGDRLPSRVR